MLSEISEVIDISSLQKVNVSCFVIENKLGASLVAQLVKNLSAMQETPVRSRGREDPLEKDMATYSSILA